MGKNTLIDSLKAQTFFLLRSSLLKIETNLSTGCGSTRKERKRQLKCFKEPKDWKRMQNIYKLLRTVILLLINTIGKMTEKEKKKAHDRLIGDAVKRKLNQEQVKQQMQLQEEEQAKILFRPKINNYNKEKQLKKSMKEKSI